MLQEPTQAKADLKWVDEHMPKEIARRAAGNIKSIRPVGELRLVSAQMPPNERVSIPSGSAVLGFYCPPINPDPEHRRLLSYATDKAMSGDMIRDGCSGHETLAHEMTHACDFSRTDDGKHPYSFTPEWQQASFREIAHGQLSDYAASRPLEAFAEYGRLLCVDPAKAQSDFPGCWKFFRDNKLV